MRYVEARIDEHRREETYRIYVTKSLQLAPQNRCLKTTYIEALNYKAEDEKTGDEIAKEIIEKAGLKFG